MLTYFSGADADKAGASSLMAGRLVSDGKGALTGSLDVNDGGVIGSKSVIGTYSVDINGRGTATFDLLPPMTFYLTNVGTGYVLGGTPAVPDADAKTGLVEPQ